LNLASGKWRRLDPSRNLAAEKRVAASSEQGTNVAKHVTDPKTYEDYVNVYWESADSDPQWIRVDLGTTKEINRVILKWGASAAKAFKIQTSVDDQNWTDFYSSSSGSSSMVTDQAFPTTTARYVRVLATERAPVITGFRGRRGAGGTATAPPAQGTTPPAQPARPIGYSLFDFMVLKD
jgi:hypothetical protein